MPAGEPSCRLSAILVYETQKQAGALPSTPKETKFPGEQTGTLVCRVANNEVTAETYDLSIRGHSRKMGK